MDRSASWSARGPALGAVVEPGADLKPAAARLMQQPPCDGRARRLLGGGWRVLRFPARATAGSTAQRLASRRPRGGRGDREHREARTGVEGLLRPFGLGRHAVWDLGAQPGSAAGWALEREPALERLDAVGEAA